MEILSSFLYQMVFTVGLVVLFGFIISLCRHLFVKLTGRAGCRTLLFTGIVGTPVHELSHALMCLIFGHRIEEIKLYDPTGEDGALGYVNHAYNKKNVYHQIGNFFIGIAPIVCGSGILLILMMLLVPEVHSSVVADINDSASIFESVGSGAAYTGYLALTWKIAWDIFSFSYLLNIKWWIFIIIAIMISSHMELSRSDIVGGTKGFLYIAALVFITNLVVGLISKKALASMTWGISYISLYILGFLWLSTIFCVVLVLVALLLKGIKRIFGGK